MSSIFENIILPLLGVSSDTKLSTSDVSLISFEFSITAVASSVSFSDEYFSHSTTLEASGLFFFSGTTCSFSCFLSFFLSRVPLSSAQLWDLFLFFFFLFLSFDLDFRFEDFDLDLVLDRTGLSDLDRRFRFLFFLSFSRIVTPFSCFEGSSTFFIAANFALSLRLKMGFSGS